MALTRAAKETLKTEVAAKFQKANATIIAEYRGLSMGDLTVLRAKLRESDAEFKVVKNRVAKVAIREDALDVEPLAENLKGPVGVVFMYGDPAAATKSVLDFAKDKPDTFKVTAGMMDGNPVTDTELKAIADLPSMDVLIAKIVGTLVAPHRGLIGVLQALPRDMVGVINAIKDKKEQEDAS